MAKFQRGDHVLIEGVVTVLQRPLGDTSGGWVVEPAVSHCCYWNEDDMTPETEGEKLVRSLYDDDKSSALTNQAARFIERMLKND